MKTDDDLILFLTRTLRELEPAVRPDVVGRLEERMRTHFGGERVYVAKPADRRVALRQARVLARLRTGESVRDVARDFGFRLDLVASWHAEVLAERAKVKAA